MICIYIYCIYILFIYNIYIYMNDIYIYMLIVMKKSMGLKYVLVNIYVNIVITFCWVKNVQICKVHGKQPRWGAPAQLAVGGSP